jgi:hypothetical protein
LYCRVYNLHDYILMQIVIRGTKLQLARIHVTYFGKFYANYDTWLSILQLYNAHNSGGQFSGEKPSCVAIVQL